MYLPISVSLNPHFREQRIDNMFQDPDQAFLKNLQRKLLFKFLPAGLAHVAAQDRIIQEELNLVSKHSNIMLRNEETCLAIIYNTGDSTFCGRYTRKAMLHSFQQDQREIFIGIKSREDKHVCGIQKSLLITAIFPAMIHHHFFQATLCHLILEHSSVNLYSFTSDKVTDKAATLFPSKPSRHRAAQPHLCLSEDWKETTHEEPCRQYGHLLQYLNKQSSQ